MMTRDILTAEHTELERLAGQLLAAVAGPADAAVALSSIRWRLNRLLMIHLAKEDQLLYPLLTKSGRPRTSGMALRFSQEMGGLASTYLSYANGWTAQRIADDWAGFGAETRKIVRALQHRILREERDLYPLIEDIAEGTSISA